MLTRRFTNALLNLDVKKGDVVAIWIPNCPHFSISYYAILSLEGIITAISPLFVSKEMSYQIKDSGAKYFIILDKFFAQYKRVQNELDLKKIV